MRFRTRLFLSSAAVAALSLAVAALLVSDSLARRTRDRIDRNLIAETRLASELLAHRVPERSPAELDEEADALGRSVEARVTLIASDGTVVGDSTIATPDLPSLENHGNRPEVIAARQNGVGVATRYSETLAVNMLYVAMPVKGTSIGFVRLALPLTEVRDQIAAISRLSGVTLLGALGAALALAWGSSLMMSRRIQRIADTAKQYAAGDLSQPTRMYERDEIGAVARVLDDTVRQLAGRVAELASDRAQMAAILGGMVEGVLVVKEDGRVQIVNATAQRMLRLTEPAAGRHYLEIIREPAVADRVTEALRGEASHAEEISLFRDPDRIFLARASPVVSAAGRGAVLVLHDLTELRRADQIRRDFVANVSHELRTPLTAILGYTEALLDAPTDQGDQTRRFVEIIGRHAGRMERLVGDLLRLTRLDAGQETLELGPCSLRSIFNDVLTELAPVIESRRQSVEVRLEPDPLTIKADAAKLHNVLRNLVHNAASYSYEGTTIALEAEHRPGRVLISVSDRGPGIPERDLPRIFERFYRVDKARARDAGGTGLGLAIVKHLVGLHGGDVHAANREGGGSVFTVSLPD